LGDNIPDESMLAALVFFFGLLPAFLAKTQNSESNVNANPLKLTQYYYQNT